MTRRWPAETHLKVHRQCGGMVRWVEAFDIAGVGMTGECLECGRENVPVEEILPFGLPDGMDCCEAYDQADIEDLRAFEWPLEPEVWDDKQAEFRELIA